jgi:transposase InsO family protein
MIKGRPPARLRHSWEARCRLVSLVLSGLSPHAALRACGMSRATAYRLLGRYRAEGWEGLRDRPPIARHCPHRLAAEAEAQIVALPRQTGWGPRALSAALGWPASTIWRVLVRHGCSRAQRQPRPAANRYEYPAVGELVHLDIKKLGRFHHVGKRILNDGMHRSHGAGWSYAHVAVDDHSRHATVQLRPGERGIDCVAFAAAVIDAYADQGTPITRILTDNGSGYRSHAFSDLLAANGIRHIRTKPYTPRTNGKAEAFIRILQREWAYGHTYPSSSHRAKALPGWLRRGTTTTDHTAASAANHHAAASHTLRGPTPRRPARLPRPTAARARRGAGGRRASERSRAARRFRSGRARGRSA